MQGCIERKAMIPSYTFKHGPWHHRDLMILSKLDLHRNDYTSLDYRHTQSNLGEGTVLTLSSSAPTAIKDLPS